MKFEPGTKVRVVKKFNKDPYEIGDEFFVLNQNLRGALRCSKERDGSYDACIYEDELEAVEPKFKVGDRVKFYPYCEKIKEQQIGTIIKDDHTPNAPYCIKLDEPVVIDGDEVEHTILWAKAKDMELLEEKNVEPKRLKVGDRVKFIAYGGTGFGPLIGTIIDNDESDVPYKIRLDKTILDLKFLWAKAKNMELLEEKRSLLPDIPMPEVKKQTAEPNLKVGDRVKCIGYNYKDLVGTIEGVNISEPRYIVRFDIYPSHTRFCRREDIVLLATQNPTFQVGDKVEFLFDINGEWNKDNIDDGIIARVLGDDPPTYVINGPSFSDVYGAEYYRKGLRIRLKEKQKFQIGDKVYIRNCKQKFNGWTVADYKDGIYKLDYNYLRSSPYDQVVKYRREHELELIASAFNEKVNEKTLVVPTKFKVGDKVSFNLEDLAERGIRGKHEGQIIKIIINKDSSVEYAVQYIDNYGEEEIWGNARESDLCLIKGTNNKTSVVPKSVTTSVNGEHPDDQFNRKESHMLDNKQEKRLKAASRYSRLSFWGGILIGTGAANIVLPVLQKAAVFVGQFLVSVGAPPQ